MLQTVYQDRGGNGDDKGAYDVFGKDGVVAVGVEKINAPCLPVLDKKKRQKNKNDIEFDDQKQPRKTPFLF